EDWLKNVAALPAVQQVKKVADKLKELNPDFDGHVEREIFDGVVKKLTFNGAEVADLAPVRALAGLNGLECPAAEALGTLKALAPLKGLPLRSINCRNAQVADLAPLQGMRLENLYLSGTAISDLTPLKDMPLTLLLIDKTNVEDLGPLQGMKL